MPDINPSDLFGFLIQDMARLMSRLFEQQPGNLAISRAQARLLAFVYLYEGSKQAEIAALMDVQKITLTKMVDELETLQLLSRRADDSDRRVRRLFMESGAKSVLNDIWQRLAEVSDIALAPLPKARKAQFLKDLLAVRKHLVSYTSAQSKIHTNIDERTHLNDNLKV